MLEEQTCLITILKEVISTYHDKMKDIINNNNSSLMVNRGIIDSFRNDLDVLTILDLNIVRAILDEVGIPLLEREEILKYLDSIKTLLTLNKEKNTSFKISDLQMQYIQLFFKKVDELDKINEEIHNDNLKKVARMTTVCGKYEELLSLLEDKDNKQYIDDMNTIELLLGEYELAEETKRNILISIMKYNKNIAYS